VRLKIDNVGSLGLVTDLDRPEVTHAAWNTAHNVRFRRNFAEPVGGYESFFTPSGEAHYLLGMAIGTTWWMVYPADTDDDGEAEAIFAYDGTTETEITWASGDYDASYKWNGCVFNGVFILNNYDECPQYWGGNVASDCAGLTYKSTQTWDNYDGSSHAYRAKVIRAYRNFLIALGIKENATEYPYLVHWSDPADPGTIPPSWDYSDPTTLSGRVDIADTRGYVVDGLSLRDVFVVYKQDSIWIMSYTGGQFQFRVDKFSHTHGILAQDCVVDIGGAHVVLGDGVVYMHDGQQVTNILDGKEADAFFRGIEQTMLSSCFLVHSREFEEVWICYVPVNGTQVTKAHVYNYKTGAWSTRDIPACRFMSLQIYAERQELDSWPASGSSYSWDADKSLSWDFQSYDPNADTPVAVGVDFYAMDEGTSADGTAFTSTLTRTGLRVADGGGQSLVREMYPRLGGQGSVSVTVGSESPLMDIVDWGSPQTFTIGANIKLDLTISGELFAVSFTSAGSERWRLSAYELDLVPIGMY
jgi:hypothetical protein